MSSLVVRRQNAWWADILRSYVVFVDGQEVAHVKNGASVEVPLPAGRHRIQLGVDWCRSPELEVNAIAGAPTVIECGPNANPLTALLYASFFRNSYLWVKPAQATA